MLSFSVVAVIPARMASSRFPDKILYPFFNVPMIEHVRRRASLSENISEVIVATCDEEIADVIRQFGGQVIMTSFDHVNGTTRMAEALQGFDYTHAILLNGDEPLVKPSHIDLMVQAIHAKPEEDAWNGVGNLENEEELDKHSFVKCSVAADGRILYCFRRSPSFAEFPSQEKYIKKVLGVIGFKKSCLQRLTKLPAAVTETTESIEQMRLIENNISLHSVLFDESLPSVNEPHEAEIVLNYILNNSEQKRLLFETIGIRV